MEFFVELYEPSSTTEPPRLAGDDTTTRITILDEDQPGTICFEETQLDVSRNAEEIEIKICRVDGADGQVSCTVRTEACGSTQGLGVETAIENVHYEPIPPRKLYFKAGQMEEKITVKLLKWQKPEETQETAGGQAPETAGGDGEDAEAAEDFMFRVILEDPEPEAVRLSRKNVAFVTIVNRDDDMKE